MLQVELLDTSLRRGHRGIGQWAGLLSKFSTRKKLCSMKEIIDFVNHEVEQHNAQKNADEIAVAVHTIRFTIARVCELASQEIENGRVVNVYYSEDVKEFGKLVKAGKRFLLD